MSRTGKVSRRDWLSSAIGSLSVLALSACDRIAQSAGVNATLDEAESWTRRAQRWMLGRHALAREFAESDISKEFRANGTTNPDTEEYNRLAAGAFAGWRLGVGGLVERPLALSLAELRAMPARTQITRHDCVEGWSCIGKWKGVRLATLLDLVGPHPDARYVMLYCADAMNLSGDKYYESIDLDGAYHPQTILAYEMNGETLPIAHGAPLRLRDERQLGYKMAKYIMRIELAADFAQIGDGKGGYWEDQGYEWWAGI